MMRRTMIATIATLLVLAPGAAFAFWNATVTPVTTTATAATQVLPPTAVTASVVSSKAVNLKATAPTTGSAIPTAYRVQRDGATVNGCDSLAFTQTCADTGLSAGTRYTYAVFGRVGSQWVSTGSAQAQATTVDAPHWTSSFSTATANSITSTQTATWTVAFSQPVAGVSPGNFQVTTVSGNAAATVDSATPSGSAPATTWTVTSKPASGTGSMRLDLKSSAGIADSGGSGLTDSVFPLSGGAGATVTVAAPPPAVTITEVDRNGNSGNYSFNGTSSNGAGVTVSVYSNYQLSGCSPVGTALTATATVTGNAWGPSSWVSLTSTSGGTYYVVATTNGAPAGTSRVYSFVAPIAQGGAVTPTLTSC